MINEHIIPIVKANAQKYGNRDVFRYRNKNTGEVNSIGWTAMMQQCELTSMALLDAGFGFESNIGIYSHNCPDWTTTDLAIFGIRGVVVPIMATSARQQIKYIIDETGMQLLFAGNEEQLEISLWLLDHCVSLNKVIVFDGGVEIKDERIITLKTYINISATSDLKNQLKKIQEDFRADDMATIVYTSGTTGEGKGVMLGMESFVSCFGYHDQRLHLYETDVSIAFLPLSHIFERTWTLYLLSKGVINFFLENPRHVIDVLPIVKPTLMCTVPRFFEKTYEGIEAEMLKWPAFKRTIFHWATKTGMRHAMLLSKKEPIPAGLKMKNSIADKLVLKKLRSVFGGNIRIMPCAGAAIRPGLLHFFHGTGLFVNYGYGCTETTATVACFREDIYDFNAVGSVMPGVSVKIGAGDEIMISGKTVFRGYYKKPEETAASLRDGWFMSGDKGRVTEDGFLYMDDRIKDLFKTSTGKYVSPQKIELLLGQDAFVEQIVAIGDKRKFVSAVIVPSFEKLKIKAAELGLSVSDIPELIKSKELYAVMAERFNLLQQELAPHERVVKFILLPELFSIENGILTSTLKIKRKMVNEKYADLIEEMYRTV
ncbi:MAG: long-chain fatty acid--CoA ligase [Bacteroidota bacterium]